MKRLMSLLAIGLISMNVGCTLCSNCDDYSYGAFGGLWERSDLTYGRVGSAFAPEGLVISEGAAPTELQAPEPGIQESEEVDAVPITPPDAPIDPAANEDSSLET